MKFDDRMQAASKKVKTVWRNSACLMLLNGPFKYKRPTLDLGAVLEKQALPNYLEIIDHTKSTDDKELLFVRRHAKSGFMANAHVFPGGVLDDADFSPKWLDLFHEIKPRRQLFSPILNLKDSGAPRLPLYNTIPDSIRGEIAFRICAIREMFEEAGVLLARDTSDIDTALDLLPGSFTPAVKLLPDSLREQWRERVHSNAEEFVTMCRELECVPDIWSLIEWSNWLTPRNSERRYDTVFYMCFVETKPPATPDGVEVKSATWMSPEKATQLFLTQKILLAPPQFAELKILEGFSDSGCLHSYALSEMISGGSSHRKSSVRIATKDSVVLSVTEHDDLFPMEGSEDWTTEIQHPTSVSLRELVPLVLTQQPGFEYMIPSHTAQELEALSQNMSRMEFHASFQFKFMDNRTKDKITNYHERYRQQLLRENHNNNNILSKL